jgi:hypothetical protein
VLTASCWSTDGALLVKFVLLEASGGLSPP